MIDSVRPRDSGKSSAAPDHPHAERRPASWQRSTKLRELGTASDEIGACGALKTFFSAELRSSLCSTPRTGSPSSSCSHSPRIMSRRHAARRERSDMPSLDNMATNEVSCCEDPHLNRRSEVCTPD